MSKAPSFMIRHKLALALALGGLTASSLVAQEKPPAGLVIIVPAELKSALTGFAKFKKKQLPTELVTLESLLKNTEGADDPEKVKRYLYQAWQERDVRYALLVGDADVFPVRFMVLDRRHEKAFNYAFFATDLYYGDVAKTDGSFDDWNANKQGFHADYIGEVRGAYNKEGSINFDQVDYHPEIAIGRWPVSTRKEARIVAKKTERQERSVLRDRGRRLRTAAMVNPKGWVDGRGLMDRMATSLGERWTIKKLYYADGKRDDSTAAPNQSQVLSDLNDGLGLLVHIGHGGSDAWADSLSTHAISSLKNHGQLPIIISAGCSTAVFVANGPYVPYVDIYGVEHKGTNNGQVFTEPPPPPSPYQEGKCNPSSMGEALLCADKDGAVAYIGCNTGGQPWALTLLEGFVKSLGQRQNPRLGDCWLDMIEYYHVEKKTSDLVPSEDWVPPSVFYQPMKYMLFGDPSMRLPTPR